ncbi:MAG: hypothetical protein AAFV28_04915 [Cyanobacteria bacterium J06635_13]
MTILFQKEFQIQSREGPNSLERIYQGKSFKGGPVFSEQNLPAAELYCERYGRKQAGAMCIIVREKSFLRIWSEVRQTEPDTVLDFESSEEETPINSLPVQKEFTSFCQNLLAQQIGPIAAMICKKTLAKNPNLNRTEFVTILAKKISDPTKAAEFKRATLD